PVAPRRLVMPATVDEQVEVQLPFHRTGPCWCAYCPSSMERWTRHRRGSSLSAWLGLCRHRPFLVRAAEDRGRFAVAGDDPYPLVELADDVLRCRSFEKRDAVLAARGKDAFARLAHLRRLRIARDLGIAESQPESAR